MWQMNRQRLQSPNALRQQQETALRHAGNFSTEGVRGASGQGKSTSQQKKTQVEWFRLCKHKRKAEFMRDEQSRWSTSQPTAGGRSMFPEFQNCMNMIQNKLLSSYFRCSKKAEKHDLLAARFCFAVAPKRVWALACVFTEQAQSLPMRFHVAEKVGSSG